MAAYYNENDPHAAQWLRNLIDAGHIAWGYVDERSIEDVRPADLIGFTQCHFFAGIGVWSYALRRAGWPDDRPVWTGSCPCQPFSSAGKRGGIADERHLWPTWHHLISVRRPGVVFGEQVASKDGLGWLDLVQADLEAADYACGPVDLCAAGVGAPHIRQRLWFVGERLDDATGTRYQRSQQGAESDPRFETRLCVPSEGRGLGGLAHSDGGRQRECQERDGQAIEPGQQASRRDDIGGRSGPIGLADSEGEGSNEQCRATRSTFIAGRPSHAQQPSERCRTVEHGGPAGPTNGFWRDADWLFCRDGKWRPVEPGTFPLAHGATARVVRLRAYGNAIVAEAACAVIEAYMDTKKGAP